MTRALAIICAFQAAIIGSLPSEPPQVEQILIEEDRPSPKPDRERTGFRNALMNRKQMFK